MELLDVLKLVELLEPLELMYCLEHLESLESILVRLSSLPAARLTGDGRSTTYEKGLR